ncbi:hypothetical protein D2T31_16500 [Sinirhodobacter populi]|uniref:Glycosyltransferase family 8 protein n=1 Tax=Paenirhodobacter populi TaxID=2306993 RepID=A0A443K3W3_9RHOB|nr:glycosyltransferase [Sinirhodobacter populi]RWR27456.1 hypothetical protein D2T31_16500 [Sinirhodobacter populi]
MNAIYLVTDDRLADVASAQALHLHRMWGVDVHLFIERKDPSIDISEVLSPGVFYHYDLLSPLLPAGLPGDKKWPNIVYLRLFVPNFLKQYDRLIYVDVDILSMRADHRIWSVPLPSGLGMVSDIATLDKVPHVFKGMTRGEWFDTIGVKSGRYANSGVLLIDPKKFSEYDFGRLLLEYFRKHPTAKTFDQDFLNWLFDGQWTEISPRFNFQAHVLELGLTRSIQPIFVHLCRSQKPWWGIQEEYASPTDPYYLRAFAKNLKDAGFNPDKYCRKVPVKSVRKMKFHIYRWLSSIGVPSRRERQELRKWRELSDRFRDGFNERASTGCYADDLSGIRAQRSGEPEFNGRYVKVASDY